MLISGIHASEWITPLVAIEFAEQLLRTYTPSSINPAVQAINDRPENRRDDILDISDMHHHYFSMHDSEIWENHFDLFTGDNIDLLRVAARVMGREMRKISIKNDKLFQLLDGILERNSADIDHSDMGAIMTGYFNNTVQENVTMILEIRKGLLDQLFPY